MTTSIRPVRFGQRTTACGGALLIPASSEPVPAVVIAPAIAGANGYIDGVAEELAQCGYACLAIDYFVRDGGPPDLTSPEKTMAAVASLPDRRVLADLVAARDYLRSLPQIAGQRMGMLGFCIGGSYALFAAGQELGFRAAVAFYGLIRYRELTEHKPTSPLDALGALTCPLLAHYGDADHLVPASDVEALREHTRGQPAEIYVYPGAGHAFHESHRPDVHRAVAAHGAWQRTLVHLNWNLGS